MARNCAKDRWEHSNDNLAQEVSEEDEDLSFCDLPVINCLTKEDDQSRKEDANLAIQNQEDQFDFSSRDGSLLKESKMCAADEVFFQGRILPLRLSVSSDTGLPRFQHESQKITGTCISRSESMDHRSTGGFGSNNSSRSSSTRSYNSSSSNSSSSTIGRTNYKPKFQNTFLTCPSPKPQIKVSTTQQGSVGIRIRNSSTWDYLRLGLLPTPEIGLQDLKVRRNSSVNKSSVSRNSSQGSSSNSVTAKNSAKINSGCRGENQRTPGFLEKGIGGLLNGCKCLDETVSSNAVIIKSSNGKNNSTSESETHAKKEKLLEVKMKKKKDEKQQQEGKQAMSRHRTSEWLKELPHAVYPPEGQTH
jgi:hypothetical protein